MEEIKPSDVLFLIALPYILLVCPLVCLVADLLDYLLIK